MKGPSVCFPTQYERNIPPQKCKLSDACKLKSNCDPIEPEQLLRPLFSVELGTYWSESESGLRKYMQNFIWIFEYPRGCWKKKTAICLAYRNWTKIGEKPTYWLESESECGQRKYPHMNNNGCLLSVRISRINSCHPDCLAFIARIGAAVPCQCHDANQTETHWIMSSCNWIGRARLIAEWKQNQTL